MTMGETKQFVPLNIAVLTVSDTRSLADDKSGTTLVERALEDRALVLFHLAADGRRASDLALPRKTVGVLSPGAAVRLDAAGPDLLVAEGLFTALSAGVRFGLPCWALLSTSNLRRWRAPDGVRRVLIAGDHGRDGERSAALLAAALRGGGLAAEVRTPPPGRGDWNDLQRAGG